jgi:hypothetical protein
MVARASSSGMSVLYGNYGGGSGRSRCCGCPDDGQYGHSGVRVQIDCTRGYALVLARDRRLERHIVSFARINLCSPWRTSACRLRFRPSPSQLDNSDPTRRDLAHSSPRLSAGCLLGESGSRRRREADCQGDHVFERPIAAGLQLCLEALVPELRTDRSHIVAD